MYFIFIFVFSHLPSKPAKETEKHRAEYNKMVENAKKMGKICLAGGCINFINMLPNVSYLNNATLMEGIFYNFFQIEFF